MRPPRARQLILCWQAAGLLLILLVPTLPGLLAEAAPASAVSVRAGRWSDPAIWQPRGVPRGGAAVTIRRGTAVVYDLVSSEEISRLDIEGTLSFSRDRSTRLDVGGVFVRPGGALEMGTARAPLPSAVSAELRLVVPAGTVFKGGGFVEGDVGVWVLDGGRWEAHGAPVHTSWTTLARPAAAGTATVYVREDLSDWPAGAEVLLTPTSSAPSDADFEERRLAGVRRGPGGLFEVKLAAPLARAHDGGEEIAGELALLTRNVRISSKYPDRTRAHTVFMEGARGGLAFAEFRELGAFGVLGRYPIHFHMMGDSSRGMTVRGVSVWRSGNHFINLHASNGVTIEDVVGYDAPGSGFFMENIFGQGTDVAEPSEEGEHPAASPGGQDRAREKRTQRRDRERVRQREASPENVDVAFVHTLAAKGIWRSGSLDQPNIALFWITSLNVILIDNVAVGARGGKNNAGFRLGSLTRTAASGLPFVMARNQARGNHNHGFFAWLNSGEVFDVVEFQGRRNGRTGMALGAYNPQYRIFRADLAENGESNLNVWMARAWVQESRLRDAPVGLFFNRHFYPGSPENPARMVNMSFDGHSSADVSQDHRACGAAGQEQTPDSRRCPAHYVVFARPAFGSPRPIDFGWHANASSWFEILDPQRPLAGLPAQFRISRGDRTGAGAPSSLVDGRVQPVQRRWDMPPVVEIATSPGSAGRAATVRVRAVDDRGVAAVEIFANGRLLKRFTAGPFDTSLPAALTSLPRLYLYARATDAAGNVSYSQVLKLQASLP